MAPNPPASNRPVPANPREAARLVIVIDDLGHNLEAPRRLLALGLPLTFSILPGRPHSWEVMALVRSAGYEFLVHVPMEPQGYPQADPGPNALMLAMDEQATRAALVAHLTSLPGAVGANNHMGSAFTDDPAKMRLVQEEIFTRGLLFLNSRTSASPVAGRIAREGGYRYLERDVFLDHDRDVDAIRAQLARVAAQARRRGWAIAIGHPYPETLRILREELPLLLRNGVEIVPISQL